MAKENTYIRIEDYLAGNLEGEALEQFERDMKNDPALAEEVSLFRDMAVAFQPDKEDDLRANLELLGQKYAPAKPANKNISRWWIVIIVCLIVVLGWWIWASVFKEPSANTPDKPAAKENAPSVAEEPAPVAPQNGVDTPTQPKSPQKGVPEKRQPEKPTQLAANFQPNPQLEALLDNQFRSDEYQFRISQPIANASLKLENGNANFRLSGVLETTAIQVNKTFRVLLFSNKPEDYDNFHPLISESLTFEKAGGQFRFELEKKLKIQPGLYYFLIEDKEEGTLLHAGRVRVE